MSKSLDDLYNLLEKINKSNQEIKVGVGDIKGELKHACEKYDTQIEDLGNENLLLKKRLIAAERKIRKNNFLIYGLQITQNKSVINTVTDFIHAKLNIQINVTDINNCYQLGNAIGKPIVLELISYLKKIEISEKLTKLKGTGVSFSDDLPFEDRQERKLLNRYLKKAKADNIPARIRKDKIIIDGKAYTLRDLQENENVDITDYNDGELPIEEHKTRGPTQPSDKGKSKPNTTPSESNGSGLVYKTRLQQQRKTTTVN